MNLNIFAEILNEKQKFKYMILFQKINQQQWIELIDIWEKSSSLLRWNNIVNKLKIYKIIESDDLNILIFVLQYYVDKKTYSLKIPQIFL